MNILLPIDDSDCSASTLAWVTETFPHKTTNYYLLYVLEPIPEEAVLIEFEKAQALIMLEQVRKKLEQAGGRVQSTQCLVGDAAKHICQYAETIGADQIVIGSHGRHGLSKWLMGSLSTQVLEHCTCPITVHKEGQTHPKGEIE